MAGWRTALIAPIRHWSIVETRLIGAGSRSLHVANRTTNYLLLQISRWQRGLAGSGAPSNCLRLGRVLMVYRPGSLICHSAMREGRYFLIFFTSGSYKDKVL